MGNSDQDDMAGEIEHLRQALDAETLRRLELERQLDRANTDFEEFVSRAAHNLREPLREAASFSQLLAESCASRFGPDAREYLEHIQDGVTRAQALLTGVVDYWATGTGDRQFSRTDMEAVLRQALLCADKQIAERSAVVTHDPLPPVMGDFETLTKVLQHLIRNAIEYCGTPSPRVHISCGHEKSEWVFAVRDNGGGIDPALQGRLFEPFRRLHGKEHPGDGLGLAFCKKAIEWHGGRMWVESEPGQGAAFYFTLHAAG